MFSLCVFLLLSLLLLQVSEQVEKIQFKLLYIIHLRIGTIICVRRVEHIYCVLLSTAINLYSIVALRAQCTSRKNNDKKPLLSIIIIEYWSYGYRYIISLIGTIFTTSSTYYYTGQDCTHCFLLFKSYLSSIRWQHL